MTEERECVVCGQVATDWLLCDKCRNRMSELHTGGCVA